MSTMPAWQLRQMQRENFLKKIEEEMFRKHEEVDVGTDHTDDTFFFELALLILEELGEKHPNAYTAKPTLSSFRRAQVFAQSFYFGYVSRPLREFSRSEEEWGVLLVRVLTTVVLPRIELFFMGELARQEFSDPKRIFHAERTDEVPIPTE